MNTWSAITPIWPENAYGPERKRLTGKSVVVLEKELLRRGCVLRAEGGDVLVSVKEIKDDKTATWLIHDGETLTLPAPIYTGELHARTLTAERADLIVTWFKAVE